MTTQTQDLHFAQDFPDANIDEWRSLVEKALKGADFDKRLVSQTADGIKINPLYTRGDALQSTVDEVPGRPPFTRGMAPVRDGLGWDIRTFHIESNPQAVNAAILDDLQGGVTSIALQVGGNGLPTTKDAFAAALAGVLLDVCPIILVAGENAFDAALALLAEWDAKGIKPSDRQGSFGADPLGTLAATGRLSEPVETALARAVALMKTTASSARVQVMTADGVVAHVAGASEAQELAFMLSALVSYLRAAEQGGISPAEALPKINVALAADVDEFSTIAKLRAARRLIWRVADACGAGDAASAVELNCPTSYRIMAKRDPWTNILRTTIACAGAALGGADAIVVLPFTFALGKPDAFARRVARNIQIVCQEESHLGRVNDPAGGSWYVESLTDDMAKKAWEIFQDIEARGGLLACLQSGFIQQTIAKTAETRAKSIATNRQELTGVNAFPLLGDDGVHTDPWPAPSAPAGKAAIEIAPLKPHRLGEAFEALRDTADAHGGFKVFLASMGEIVDHNVRTTWTKNYLAAGGIAALISDGYKTPEDAVEAFRKSGASAACICSSDAINSALAAPTATALKAAGAALVLMAGRPGDSEAALKAAGVDQFLFAGADAVATLKGLQEKLA
ncbi:methylmalonyl-CoA mutase family protein [Hyphomicrobium sp.]|jgi:methylmalonyl-CoA mutase|uniref:methylmalonyl-CoA mutase family protein n=1 Tax=Hyphomicrobium sp. TaxID=82 RepID=UPI003561E2A1